MLEWEWWHDINTCRVFIYLLLKANWKDSTWKGIEVKRGTYISSLDKVAVETDLTRDEVRTALKHLTKTKEITTVATRKYTVFSVVNYDLYQNVPTQNPIELPNKSPTIPLLFPSREERKEVKKGINNISCAIPEESHDSFFERIWKLYPIKKGKGQVSKTKKQVLQRIGYEELERCVNRFVKTMESEHRDKQYWMHGSTFFNSGYVDYLDKNWSDTEYSTKVNKPAPKNKFTGFEQREYDFDDIEKGLLEKK